jgi:hypothetical protein
MRLRLVAIGGNGTLFDERNGTFGWICDACIRIWERMNTMVRFKIFEGSFLFVINKLQESSRFKIL